MIRWAFADDTADTQGTSSPGLAFRKRQNDPEHVHSTSACAGVGLNHVFHGLADKKVRF